MTRIGGRGDRGWPGWGNAPRRGRFGLVAVCVLAMIVVVGCGAADTRGVELGHLRGLARRVEGGGVECPLSIPDDLLRPSTVPADEPVVPFRTDGPGSKGTLGTEGATKGRVRITCRYRMGNVVVTVDVAGVPKGHAIGEFADRLSSRTDRAGVFTFVDVNADLPVGKVRTLPGTSPAAFARVSAASGDVAVIYSVDPLEKGAVLPDSAEVDKTTLAIAKNLVN